jgi:CheY-like chemotaxis protein
MCVAGNPARVLIVDDDGMFREVLALILDDAGFQTRTAAAPPEALRMIETGEQFDAILCDMVMPGMTGLQFYGELAKRAPALAQKVVLMTGDLGLVEAARMAQPPLAKPFAIPEVIEAMRRVCARD